MSPEKIGLRLDENKLKPPSDFQYSELNALAEIIKTSLGSVQESLARLDRSGKSMTNLLKDKAVQLKVKTAPYTLQLSEIPCRIADKAYSQCL